MTDPKKLCSECNRPGCDGKPLNRAYRKGQTALVSFYRQLGRDPSHIIEKFEAGKLYTHTICVTRLRDEAQRFTRRKQETERKCVSRVAGMNNTRYRTLSIVSSDDDFIDTDSKSNSSKNWGKGKHVHGTKSISRESKSNILDVSRDSGGGKVMPNCSVLEKSSIYFDSGEIDPRARMIVERTKSSLESIDKDLKEADIRQGSTQKRWNQLFDRFNLSNEEEEADRDTVFSDFVDSSDIDSSDEDSEELEILDENDESRKSTKENSGKELAKYLIGHSTQVKSKLCAASKSNQKDALLHISGSMSTDICQGQFSNYKNTFTIKAFGLNLSFSQEYLDTIRAMTGIDIRHCAYQIEMAGPDAPVTKNTEDVKVLRNMATLRNPSLVNQSVSSEINLSLKTKRLLKTSVSEPSTNRSCISQNKTLSSDMMNNTMRSVRLRNMLSSPKFKVESKDIKPFTDQQQNISMCKKSDLNRSKRMELSLLKMLTPQKPKLEQPGTVDCNLKSLNSTSFNNTTEIIQSRRVKRVLSMLTPRKQESLKHVLNTKSGDINAPTQFKYTSNFKVEKTDEPQFNSRDTTLLSKVSPDLQRCKYNADLTLNAISPVKRSHIQSLDVTLEGSPSKRIKFQDESVLSSTRIDDAEWMPTRNFDASFPDQPNICNSRKRNFDNHQHYYRGNEMRPANDFRSAIQGDVISTPTDCCQPSCQLYRNDYHNGHSHDLYHDSHLSNSHPWQEKCKHRQPSQSMFRHDVHGQQFEATSWHQSHLRECRNHGQFSRHVNIPSHLQPLGNQNFSSHLNRGYNSGPLKEYSNIRYSPQQQTVSYTREEDSQSTTFNESEHFPPSSNQREICPRRSKRIIRNYCQKNDQRKDTSKMIDSKTEMENLSESKQLAPVGSSMSKSAIEIPIVTQLLKGLNSSSRKLTINVAYDVKLAEDCKDVD